MKRFLIYMFAFLFTLSIVGCAYERDIDDQEVPQAPPLVNNSATNNDTTYLTSLRGINNSLRRSLDDMRTVNTNDSDYYVRQGEYYTTRANAYKKAYDELNRLDYRDEHRDNHRAIRDYYQSGYRTFNNLGTRYQTFLTPDDETAFKNEVGDKGFDVGDDFRTGYYDAMDTLGIDLNR